MHSKKNNLQIAFIQPDYTVEAINQLNYYK